MSFDMKEHIVKCAKQRAALMAILSYLMDMSDEDPIKDAKMMVATKFAKLIDDDLMVGDDIDSVVLLDIRKFLHQEQAYRQANNIVNPDKPL